MAAVSEIAGDRRALSGDLPLCLVRQPFAGPFGESVGLVKADMANRLAGVQPAAARQREDRPLPVFATPIERRVPTLLANRRPAIRQPEFRPAVGTILDETEKFATGHRPRREAERFDPNLVTGRLVVEGEIRPLVSDLFEPTVKVDPNERRSGRLHMKLRRLIGRQ